MTGLFLLGRLGRHRTVSAATQQPVQPPSQWNGRALRCILTLHKSSTGTGAETGKTGRCKTSRLGNSAATLSVRQSEKRDKLLSQSRERIGSTKQESSLCTDVVVTNGFAILRYFRSMPCAFSEIRYNKGHTINIYRIKNIYNIWNI